MLSLLVCLQIGGKHANFRPIGEAAGSGRVVSLLSHMRKNEKNPNSENGKAHQPEVQVSEITAVVKYGYPGKDMFLTDTFTQSTER